MGAHNNTHVPQMLLNLCYSGYSDYVYNGYYINSMDSTNFNTAKGFNYHQGPVSLYCQSLSRQVVKR